MKIEEDCVSEEEKTCTALVLLCRLARGIEVPFIAREIFLANAFVLQLWNIF